MLGLMLEKDGLNRPAYVHEEDPSRARWICTANNLYTLGLHIFVRSIVAYSKYKLQQSSRVGSPWRGAHLLSIPAHFSHPSLEESEVINGYTVPLRRAIQRAVSTTVGQLIGRRATAPPSWSDWDSASEKKHPVPLERVIL